MCKLGIVAVQPVFVERRVQVRLVFAEVHCIVVLEDGDKCDVEFDILAVIEQNGHNFSCLIKYGSFTNGCNFLKREIICFCLRDSGPMVLHIAYMI